MARNQHTIRVPVYEVFPADSIVAFGEGRIGRLSVTVSVGTNNTNMSGTIIKAQAALHDGALFQRLMIEDPKILKMFEYERGHASFTYPMSAPKFELQPIANADVFDGSLPLQAWAQARLVLLKAPSKVVAGRKRGRDEFEADADSESDDNRKKTKT